MQFIDLASQYHHLKTKIDARIQRVLDHGKYIMGPEVQELEERLAEYTGVKHVVSCANGTDALQLALMALDIKQGDIVFCPTFTFFATAEVVSLVGATPVFVDSDKSTFNICPVDLEAKISNTIASGKGEPKAIIAVDLFGLPANYPQLESIAKKYNLSLIEDAAQGFGGNIEGKKACSYGHIATTSFFPAKPLGCYGDGGAIFTNSDYLADLCRSFRVHGKGTDKYDNVRIGLNSRLDTLQAAILLEKLAQFPTELVQRNALANKYMDGLNNEFVLPFIPEDYYSSWAQFTLQSDSRDEVMSRLREAGIPTAVYYGTCLHKQTAFNTLESPELPVAEQLANQVFSLPMHPYMSEADCEKVLSVLVQ